MYRYLMLVVGLNRGLFRQKFVYDVLPLVTVEIHDGEFRYLPIMSAILFLHIVASDFLTLISFRQKTIIPKSYDLNYERTYKKEAAI